jgi:hypothetical protein
LMAGVERARRAPVSTHPPYMVSVEPLTCHHCHRPAPDGVRVEFVLADPKQAVWLHEGCIRAYVTSAGRRARSCAHIASAASTRWPQTPSTRASRRGARLVPQWSPGRKNALRGHSRGHREGQKSPVGVRLIRSG